MAGESALGGASSFIGNSVGEAAAFAAGIAIGPLLAPLLQAIENETWSQFPDKPLAATLVGAGVAERKIDQAAGAKEAGLTGISPSAFNDLVTILRKAPGIAEALNLIRRGQLAPDTFADVLNKSGLEDEWLAAYQALSATGLQPYEVPLSPPDLALGLIRGNLNVPDVDGAPLFPLGGSTAGSTVPLDPVAGIDVIKEAAASGMNPERMATIARNVGLPPGVIEGLNMLNRGIINEAAFYLLIAQSDARLSWGPFLLELRNAILTAHDYAELHLRGYITQQAMYDGGALSGHSPALMDHIFSNLGRPLAIHQITTALARGATFNPEPGEITDPYEASAHESNLKPAYYEMAVANKYTYPPIFVLNNLVKAKAIDAATAAEWATKNGSAPEVVAALLKFWNSEAPTTGTAATKSAATSAVRAIQKAYVQGNTTQAEAQAELTKLGEDQTTYPALFTAWDVSKAAYLEGLSNVQIRNRYRSQALTEAEALALLEGRGLDAATATAYLTA